MPKPGKREIARRNWAAFGMVAARDKVDLVSTAREALKKANDDLDLLDQQGSPSEALDQALRMRDSLERALHPFDEVKT